MTAEGGQMTNIQASDRQRLGDSVVYSFFQKWEQPIRSGKVRIFFRKRIPSQRPWRVYFYVGSPKAEIIGSAAVDKLEELSKKEALLLIDQGCISYEELDKYIGDRKTVGAIYISEFRFFSEPVSLSKIRTKISLSPPQNFQKLSESEQSIIEGMASVS